MSEAGATSEGPEKKPFGKNGLMAWIDEDGEEVIDVPLRRPLEAHGETRETLQFREPTIKQLKSAESYSDSQIGMLAEYISICAGIPHTVAAGIKTRDASKCREALQHFLPGVFQTTEG